MREVKEHKYKMKSTLIIPKIFLFFFKFQVIGPSIVPGGKSKNIKKFQIGK